MKTTWQASWSPSKTYPKLESHIAADVAIVGGGITGITLAYFLARAGKKVVVIEQGTLGESSTTAYTTAFLTYEVDTELQDLERMFGAKKADLVWQSGKDAIQSIEYIIREESIDCEFMRCDEYLFAAKQEEWQTIEQEATHAQKAGYPLKIKNDPHKPEDELPFPNAGYVVIPNQAKFHPLKYIDGVRRAAEKHGAIFFENTEVSSIEGNRPAIVYTKEGKGSVTAMWITIATYNPFNQPHELFAKKGTYDSYIYELSIPRGALPEGLYLDGENPYHYFRVDAAPPSAAAAGSSGEYRNMNRDRFIIGGEDHRAEIRMDPKKNFAALLAYAKHILGDQPFEIVTKWTGPILETLDGLPLIGSYSRKYPNRLVATGFSGNGMTYSMVAAVILSDHILNKHSPYADLYDPKRHYPAYRLWLKFRDYAEELIHGALKNFFRKA
ncbi:MAG: puuB [Candidatus Taylorbacteria bacterium]|nr:puuB [Candidatus Taylorbacteria bacterium]